MLFLLMILVGFAKTIYACELPFHLKDKKEASITLNGKNIVKIEVDLIKQSSFLCRQQPKQATLTNTKTPFTLDMDLSVYEDLKNLDIQDLSAILRMFAYDFTSSRRSLTQIDTTGEIIEKKIQNDPAAFWKIIEILQCNNVPKQDILAELTLSSLEHRQFRSLEEEQIYKKLSPLHSHIKSKLGAKTSSVIATKLDILKQQVTRCSDAQQRDSISVLIQCLETLQKYDKPENLEDFLEKTLSQQEKVTEDNLLGIKTILFLANTEITSLKTKEVKLNFASSNLHSLVGLETLYELLEKKGYFVTEIDVSGNHLTSLPFNLANMPTVKSIKANNNKISITSLSQFKLNQGITLDLSGNYLSTAEYQKVSQQLLPINNSSVATKFFLNTAATCFLASAFVGGIIGAPIAWASPKLATPFRTWFNGFMNIGDTIGSSPYTCTNEQKNTLISGKPQHVDAFYYQWRQKFAWLERYLK